MSMTSNLCVVKKYHTFIKLNAGYANFVCVGILPLLLVSFLDFERKLKTGCGKAFNIAFPNRQVVDLPNNGLANSPKDMSRKTPSPQRATNVVQTPVAGLVSYLGGSSKGATPLYVY